MKQSSESQVRLSQLTKKFVQARNDSGLKKTNYRETLRKEVASMASEGMPAPFLARELGIAAATVKAWKKRYSQPSSELEPNSDFLPLKVEDKPKFVKERCEPKAVEQAAQAAKPVIHSTQEIDVHVTKLSIKAPAGHLEAVLSRVLAGETSL